MTTHNDSLREGEGWIPAQVMCNCCSHIWIAVYPAELEKLECPNCENMTIFNVIKYTEQ